MKVKLLPRSVSEGSDIHYLSPMFAPRSVALVGATEKPLKLGRLVLENLLQGGFRGEIFAINPKYTEVLGQPCWRSLTALEQAVDLVVVVTPVAAVEGILRDAAKLGVPAAVILTAGYAEMGEAGRQRQRELTALARELGIRLLGPNCIGLMRTSIGLNATFAHTGAQPGRLGLVSQSGAICAAILDWAKPAGLGFSTVISLGAAADVDFGEAIDYLLADAETDAILLYVEGIRDARRFLSSLRAAARTKPVVVLKAGRHETGTRAATSHTGSLVGSDAVFAAALRRCGSVRVNTYTQLFAAARILAAGRIPRGNRLAVVTNGGGPGVMAADCAAENDVVLAELSASTIEELDALLPPHWSHGNPVDIIGDATPERFERAVTMVLADPAVDGLLALYCPTKIMPAGEAAQGVIRAAAGSTKPVLTAWLGQLDGAEIRGLFEAARVPNFYTPENSVEAFSFLAAYQRNQQLLLQVPAPLPALARPDLAVAQALRAKALAEGRDTLTETEAKQLLAAFGIEVPQHRLATSLEEASAAARAMHYPVVLKIHSPDITHKSDVGGVRLNLLNGRMLAAAYNDMMEQVQSLRPDARIEGVVVQPMLRFRHSRELLIGVATDPVFGPVISFGSGGIAVEALRDTAVMLPPLNRKLALDIIARTRVSRLLGAYRHLPPVDQEAIVGLLLQVSALVASLPWIREMDLNPVMAHEHGAVVADARIVIDATQDLTPQRYRHMAIHPYPEELEADSVLKNGASVRIRPIRPEDAAMERQFVHELSNQSRYLRFLHHLPELPPEMLARFTQIDYDREMALIAVAERGAEEHIVAVARYVQNPDRVSAEFAIVVGDAWQNLGLGRVLLTRLLDCARASGFERIDGMVLASNAGMLRMMEAMGFTIEPREQHEEVHVHIDLLPPGR
jgi:acetyltransferase